MAAPPTARTFIAGEIEVDGYFNAGLRDPINFLRTKPMCVVSLNNAYGILGGVVGAVPWDTEPYDPFNFHTGTSSRLQPTYSGWYTVRAFMVWQGSASGYRQLRFTVNGGGAYGGCDATNIGANAMALNGESVPVFLNGNGDYCEVTGFQNTSGALNVLTGSYASLTLESA
jgi:hypothetical protein